MSGITNPLAIRIMETNPSIMCVLLHKRTHRTSQASDGPAERRPCMHRDILADRFTQTFNTVLARVVDVMQFGLISLYAFVHYSIILSAATSPRSKLTISQFWKPSSLCLLSGKTMLCSSAIIQHGKAITRSSHNHTSGCLAWKARIGDLWAHF